MRTPCPLLFSAAVLLTAFAAQAEPPTSARTPELQAPTAQAPAPVAEAKKATVCRKEAVTGRRIAKATCRRTKDIEVAQEASREWMRRGSQINHVHVHKSLGDGKF